MSYVNGGLKPNKRAAMRGYSAGFRGGWNWFGDQDHPIWLTYTEIDRMMRDEQVYLGYEMLYAPICTVKVQCKCKDERVKAFVERQFHRFWIHDLQKAFRMVAYGHSGGEVILSQRGKYLEYESFVEAHPMDVTPMLVESTGGLWGVCVRGAGMDKGAAYLPTPYSVWFVNEPQFGSWFGRSRLTSVWYAWNEKRGGGAKSASGARKTWFVKNAFSGGSMRYPRESWEDPDTGEIIYSQNFAMEILEKFETGGVLAMPSDTDESGRYKWEYSPPVVNGQIGDVLEWGDRMDASILRGWGIPPEVVQASGEPGGGFAGRALPALMFYKREDGVADSIAYPFDRQVVRHLVKHNFGDVEYEIEPSSLVPKDPENGGEAQQPSQVGVQPGAAPAGGGGGGFEDILGSMSDKAQFSLGNVQLGWEQKTGERGGKFWQNTENPDDKRYQKNKPTESESRPKESASASSDVYEVQESDLIKDGKWTDKAIKIGKILFAVANTAPNATKILVREAGYSERVQNAALMVATIGDWSVPGIPAGSALIAALTLASSPTLPIKLTVKAAKAVAAVYQRMKSKTTRLSLSENPSEDIILAVGDWLESVDDFQSAVVVLGTAVDQIGDVATALKVAKVALKEMESEQPKPETKQLSLGKLAVEFMKGNTNANDR